MLEVQKYLIDTKGDFEGLNRTLGIKANFHPNDERVILNYDQLESPKLNSIVRECRSLTLNRHDYSIIAKSFFRFLNWGEGTRDEMNRFHWDNCVTTEKVDGSLISYFYWKDKWHVQTRNSYGDGFVNNSIYTWRDIFEMALGDIELEPVEGRTYVMELCSPYNQVVQLYKEPTLYLLSIFDGAIEWTHEAVESFSQEFCLKRPFSTLCRDPFEVNSEVARYAERKKDFEGLIIRDFKNTRFKFKSDKYLLLHGLANNGNISSVSSLINIVVENEIDEMLLYFPYIEESLIKIKSCIDKLIKDLDDAFYCFHDIDNKKKFAEKIKLIPYNHILFSLFGVKYQADLVKLEIYKNPNKLKEYIKRVIV